MKSENEKKVVASESRKIRKPLMEKKRRARINDSLETLKQILLDSKTTLKESSSRRNGQRTAKLEKADILEMTVRYVQHLRGKLNQKEDVQETKNCDTSERKVGVTLIPTKLINGDIVFVMPSSFTSNDPKSDKLMKMDNVWRPW